MRRLPAPADSWVDVALVKEVSRRRMTELANGRPIRFQVLEPAVVAAFEGAWPHADSSEVRAITGRSRRRAAMGARLDAALRVEVGDTTIAGLVAELVAIDPTDLEPAARLRYVLLADRVSAWGQAQASRA